MKVRVAAKSVEALDICSFELVAVDGGSLPAFSAGSHIDVKLGVGLERQYSLCNDPKESHRYQIAVLRDTNSRGGSVAMHERVNVGDVIEVSAPKNHFPLAHDAKKHLLLAGGIGVTPILCMAERLAATGAVFEMHYCTRSAERTAFRQRIQQGGFSDRIHFHFDDGDAAQRFDVAARLGPSGHVPYVLRAGGQRSVLAMLLASEIGTARSRFVRDVPPDHQHAPRRLAHRLRLARRRR